MTTLHLTTEQAAYLKTQMRLTAMNDPRNSRYAEGILDALATATPPSVRTQLESVFADLYPSGGRE
jgi:hypothetical protein